MELVIKETLQKLLDVLGINCTDIRVHQEVEGVYEVQVDTDQSSLLIGRRGDNLAALQHMLKTLILNQGVEPSTKIVIDIDGYKKRQEERVIEIAEKKAAYVIKSKRPVFMPPMNPYLRRKVHLYLASNESFKDAVTTQSVGQGDRRQLKIMPV